jgi:hypothetical protein
MALFYAVYMHSKLHEYLIITLCVKFRHLRETFLAIFELSLVYFLNIFHSYVVYACLPCKFVYYLVQDLSENHFVRKLPENKY